MALLILIGTFRNSRGIFADNRIFPTGRKGQKYDGQAFASPPFDSPYSGHDYIAFSSTMRTLPEASRSSMRFSSVDT